MQNVTLKVVKKRQKEERKHEKAAWNVGTISIFFVEP
jgi:hypothetical protein